MGAHDFGQDVFQVGGPDEGPRVFLVRVDKGIERLLQSFAASEAAPADALGGELTEPALDRPGSCGGAPTS